MVISQVTTPPVVSVDAGGSVTFINSIPARTDLLAVTLATDVTLSVPSGRHVIPSGGSWVEDFASSCLTCTVTYTYRVTAGILPLLRALPGLPASLPLIVNTIVPLPNLPLPPVNLPSVPAPSLPLPTAPSVPSAPVAPVAVPNAPAAPGSVPSTTAAPRVPTGSAPAGSGATGGTSNTGATVGEQTPPTIAAPLDLGAANGFEELLRAGSPESLETNSSAGAEEAQTPIPDVLVTPPSSGNAGPLPVASEQTVTVPDILGTPVLLAVLLLSVVAAGLVRTTVLARRTKQVGAHSAG